MPPHTTMYRPLDREEIIRFIESERAQIMKRPYNTRKEVYTRDGAIEALNGVLVVIERAVVLVPEPLPKPEIKE